MKIQQAQLALTGQRTAMRQHFVQTRLQQETPPPPPPPPPASSTVTLSNEALNKPPGEAGLDLRAQLASHPLWSLIQQLIKKLTGRELNLDDIVPSGEAIRSAPATPQPSPSATAWRVEYQRVEVLHETEHTQFSAQGEVQTEDGRQIHFSAVLDLYREFHQISETRLQIGSPAQKKDPLVLNFAAASASLQQSKLSFDLDADGREEQIAMLGQGSAYLALDHNQDGQINDGRELFGAQSGNGFADLSEYDEDGNGWIDENDTVWGKLQLWFQDEQGQLQLQNLTQMGIGALYLGNARSDFSLTDPSNQEHGQIRRSGVFLHEDGQLGTLQQVDLVV